MVTFLPNVGDVADWQLVYSQSFDKGPELPVISIPNVFGKGQHIFTLCTNAPTKGTNWYRAGYLSQHLLMPGVGSSLSQSSSQVAVLNNCKLFDFPRTDTQFRLKFKPVPWLTALELDLYVFSGTDDDIQNRLSRIEQTVNRIEDNQQV